MDRGDPRAPRALGRGVSHSLARGAGRLSAGRRAAREVAIGLGSYAAYLVVRRLVLTDRGRRRARRNAELLVAVERRAGIGVEPWVQRHALRAPVVVHVLNAGYGAANVGLTVGWLLALHRRGDPAFVRERRAAVGAFVGALPVFLALPVAPPRTLDGFVDTLAERGIDLEHPLLVRFYNPIAAMPSHHLAFAVVTASGIAARRRSAPARAAWRSYPALVALVVVATGNHYVADVVAGAALGAVARACTR